MTPLELGWHPHETWDWLVSSPLFGITITLAAYALGRWAHRRTGSPLLQPVVVAIAVIVAVLLVADIDYDQYLAGGSYIGFWLGPATVALALPLHHEWHLVRRAALPILTGVSAGALVSVLVAVGATKVGGGSRVLQLTMAPKAATTPVSIALSAQIGGIPALTAVLTILAGILGAVAGPWLLDRLGITDLRARGIALGTVSHGIGTSRALHESRTEGAFSALAMALSALATSVLVPLLTAVV
ncbi:MAG: LrgB family protein [Nocardioidaceae bacterium]|nr:LrgB family protein [Nocardioidaceae bacterium]